MYPDGALREGPCMKFLCAVVAWVLLALLSSVSVVSAQQAGRVYKIGWLWIGSPGYVPPPIETWPGVTGAFRDALRDAGFVAGKNYVIVPRHADGDSSRLAAEAQALV